MEKSLLKNENILCKGYPQAVSKRKQPSGMEVIFLKR